MKIDIIKIGNSKGIRLPKVILEQCGFTDQLELEVKAGEVVLRKPEATPARHPREGWEAAIDKVIAEHGLPDEEPWLDFPNEFDDIEWTWPDVDALPTKPARPAKRAKS